MIQGRSVEEVPEGVEVPEVKGWGSGRMDVRAFKAKIEVLSPTSARTSIVANIDPNAPVPQSVVNFVVRAQFSAPKLSIADALDASFRLAQTGNRTIDAPQPPVTVYLCRDLI